MALNDTITALGTSIINLVNSKVAKLGIANVKDFGAAGDGETDDTEAFVAAKATNKIIFFPAGTYLINSRALEITYKGQAICGENPHTTKIKIVGSSGVILNGSASPAYRSKQSICNLQITSDSSNMADFGIRIYRNAEVVIDNVFIQSCKNGIELLGGLISSIKNTTVSNCLCSVQAEASNGLACNLNNFENCRFINCYRQGLVWGSGSGNTFTTCEIENTGKSTKLSLASQVGDTSITVEDSSYLQIGDELNISQFRGSTTLETKTIQSISDNVITFSESLKYAHEIDDICVLNLPITIFPKTDGTGSSTLSFNGCWFEGNKGEADIKVEPNNDIAGYSVFINGTTFLSTTVINNIYVNNCNLYTIGCTAIPTIVTGHNLYVGPNCRGYSLSRFGRHKVDSTIYMAFAYDIHIGGASNPYRISGSKTFGTMALDLVNTISISRENNKWYFQSYLDNNALFSQGIALYGDNSLGKRPIIIAGTGSPEGVKSAAPGSIYLNVDGGTGTTLYVKESGTGNTGWVAK